MVKPDGPTTRDGRFIPSMSVDANRVYWAMRADRQAESGIRVERIASMVGMERADVVVAGEELLEHCLIFTNGEGGLRRLESLGEMSEEIGKKVI